MKHYKHSEIIYTLGRKNITYSEIAIDLSEYILAIPVTRTNYVGNTFYITLDGRQEIL